MHPVGNLKTWRDLLRFRLSTLLEQPSVYHCRRPRRLTRCWTEIPARAADRRQCIENVGFGSSGRRGAGNATAVVHAALAALASAKVNSVPWVVPGISRCRRSPQGRTRSRCWKPQRQGYERSIDAPRQRTLSPTKSCIFNALPNPNVSVFQAFVTTLHFGDTKLSHGAAWNCRRISAITEILSMRRHIAPWHDQNRPKRPNCV